MCQQQQREATGTRGYHIAEGARLTLCSSPANSMCASVSGSPHEDGKFRTTQWSLVLTAAGNRSDESQEALAILCRRYWMPLYVFARRSGHQQSDAQDLTQSYFERLLDKAYLADADRERGRFRTFLLSSFRHFLSNEWDRQTAQKRGGDQLRLSLNFSDGESLHDQTLTIETTPENLFDRHWAETVLERVMDRLQREQERGGKGREFAGLRQFMSGRPSDATLKSAAEELGISDAAARMAVSRLRSRYRDLMKSEISDTVDSPDDIDAEIFDLFNALSG